MPKSNDAVTKPADQYQTRMTPLYLAEDYEYLLAHGAVCTPYGVESERQPAFRRWATFLRAQAERDGLRLVHTWHWDGWLCALMQLAQPNGEPYEIPFWVSTLGRGPANGRNLDRWAREALRLAEQRRRQREQDWGSKLACAARRAAAERARLAAHS